MENLNELSEAVKKVMSNYKKRHPEIKVDRDYFPFKVTEEWGECLQTYLMLTSRGRKKGKTKEEIQDNFVDEMADVLGFFLLFADNENIDLIKALERKWFQHLE